MGYTKSLERRLAEAPEYMRPWLKDARLFLFCMTKTLQDAELDDEEQDDEEQDGLKTFTTAKFGESKNQEEQKEFLLGYEPQNIVKIQESLCQQMHDPSCFQVALQEMPSRLVTLLTMCVKIGIFEFAYQAVGIILGTGKSNEQKKKWAKILHELLNQLVPQWDKIACKNLDRALNVLIKDFRECDQLKVKEFKTIPEAFETNGWPGLELLYTQQKDSLLRKDRINKIMLIAAKIGNWSIFIECFQQGADVSATVDASHGTLLEEAVKCGGFELQQLELAGGFPQRMVNATDRCCGNTLLHWVIEDQMKEVAVNNVRFLMKHKANFNIANKLGYTVIQELLRRTDIRMAGRRGNFHDVDILVAIVEGADKVEADTWAPVIKMLAVNWEEEEERRTVLRVLCTYGRHQHIVPLVEKGADPSCLHYKLSLIDLVILTNELRSDQKEKTLAVLLNSPLSLGPFHASVVAQRPLKEENMVYKDQEILANEYLYPVQLLLFPRISTHALRRKHLDLVKMLVEGGAVCDTELLALKPHLQRLKDDDRHEAAEYLQPLIEAVDTKQC